MRRIVFVLLVVFSLQNVHSQDFELIRHQVRMGETVRMLSKKYKVEPAEIYRLNRFAVDGISQGMVLQILVPRKEVAVETVAPEPEAPVTAVADVQASEPKPAESEPIAAEVEIDHKVEKGETLYGLAKKYLINIEDLKSYNAQALRNGLKIGQVLKIRSKIPQ